MMRGWRIAALAALLVFAGGATARPFTARDLAMLDRVSDPRLSPDARRVAYNLRSTDWDNNRGVHALYLRERGAGGEAIRLVGGEKAPTNPRWANDAALLPVGQVGVAAALAT